MITINSIDVLFGQDMILDEEAFEKAANDFESLSEQLNSLRRDIEEMINELKAGFDTPAGVKFINSCEKNLFKPLDDQKLVIDHIKETLKTSRQQYQSVFDEYESLRETINNVKQ